MLRSTRRKCKSERNKTIAKLDALCSQSVRAKGKCEASGILSGECIGDLQTHHISKRRHMANRFKPHNLVCLCARHHGMMDSKECENALLAVIRKPEQLEDLVEGQAEICKDNDDLKRWLTHWKGVTNGLG